MNKTYIKNLIRTFVISAVLMSFSLSNVYADQYGGVEYINKRFTIEKKVRIQGDDSWKDKVTDVKEGDVIEFRIKIKNKSDDEADDFDNMKMEDFLPDELIRIGGSGLTEYWDNFESGETKTFEIEAKIDSDEFDRDDNFEKCVVNEAEVNWDGEFEGSDTATVCYGDEEPTELPKTGSESIYFGLAGLASIVTGLVIKKRKISKA